VGLTFAALPVFYAVAAFVLLRQKREVIRTNSVFAASVAVGVVYMHYAFARADVGHLAHAIFPFLFALLSLSRTQLRGCGFVAFAMPPALLAYSVFAAGMMSPFYAKASHRGYVDIDVRGDTLSVDPETARAVRAVQVIGKHYMHRSEQIVFAPYWPTMYGVLHRRAPVWETYSTLGGDVDGQRRFTQELETGHVEWALIGNATLDQREDRRFSNTHPITWDYLMSHYEKVPIDGLPSDYQLLRRRPSNL
jgi:hypothetical protein